MEDHYFCLLIECVTAVMFFHENFADQFKTIVFMQKN